MADRPLLPDDLQPYDEDELLSDYHGGPLPWSPPAMPPFWVRICIPLTGPDAADPRTRRNRLTLNALFFALGALVWCIAAFERTFRDEDMHLAWIFFGLSGFMAGITFWQWRALCWMERNNGYWGHVE